MADTIRTGIVGATVTQGGSGWGANAHVPALHLLPDYTLQAVCTAHKEARRAPAAGPLLEAVGTTSVHTTKPRTPKELPDGDHRFPGSRL